MTSWSERGRRARVRTMPLHRLVWLFGLVTTTAGAQVLDSFVDERRACRRAQEAGRLEAAFDCIQALWTSHGDEMDVPGKIETLQQMAELYIVSSEPDEARTVYEYILATLDNAWRPADFEYQPTAWREVFLAAQDARGITGNPPELRNVALLDFVVTSFGETDDDLRALTQTLPMYITTRLQETIEASPAGQGEHALRVIPSRDRASLLRAIGEMAGAAPGEPVTEANAPADVLLSAGRLHAVHAFVKGTIIFMPGDDVQIAVQMIPVEDARVRCPVTASASVDDLFAVLGDALDELLQCAFDVAATADLDAHVGPTRTTAQGLRHLHAALLCQEDGDIDCALREARKAQDLLPDDPAVADVVAGLQHQEALMAAQREVALPAPRGLDVDGAPGETPEEAGR